MRLTIVSVGHKMPDWVATATQDYIKRMPADCSIEIKEIKPDLTPAKEAVKIAAAIPKGSRVIALDERGKDQTTQNLATQLANWRQEGFDITFLHPKANDEFPIGGEGVLIELVQAPAEVVKAFAALAASHA